MTVYFFTLKRSSMCAKFWKINKVDFMPGLYFLMSFLFNSYREDSGKNGIMRKEGFVYEFIFSI